MLATHWHHNSAVATAVIEFADVSNCQFGYQLVKLDSHYLFCVCTQ